MNRILIYIIALLVLANVGFLWWPGEVSEAPHIYPSKKDVNPHFVRLNKEIEDRFYGAPSTQLVESPALTSAELSVLSSDAVVSSAECYRVGPFLHQANYELAQAVLFNTGVPFEKSSRASKASNVYRVFLGFFESEEDVAVARKKLNESGVRDHFVRIQDDGSKMISLGIYSTEESVNEAVTLFERRIDDVRTRSENVVLPDSFWLHFSANQGDHLLSQLNAIDWGEPSAKMGLFDCDSSHN